MDKVYILLGANLENPIRQLQRAVSELSSSIGRLNRQSAIYESAAWGKEDQPIFLNQVLCFETELTPQEILSHCQKVENNLGRVRKEKWDARIIDIDILYFNDEILESTDLTIPHPLLHLRKFTLEPLIEIAPNYIHPVLKRTNKELFETCTDTLFVKKLAMEETHGI